MVITSTYIDILMIIYYIGSFSIRLGHIHRQRRICSVLNSVVRLLDLFIIIKRGVYNTNWFYKCLNNVIEEFDWLLSNSFIIK